MEEEGKHKAKSKTGGGGRGKRKGTKREKGREIGQIRKKR